MGSQHYYSSTSDCYDILKTLLPKGFSLNTTTTIGDNSSYDHLLIGSSANVTYEAANFLVHLCGKVDVLEASDKYSRPMVWIGFYIAAASLICTATMAADLVHAFRNRKLCDKCCNETDIGHEYMTTPMTNKNDQAAKLGSLAFICTIMANSMPSLASMSNKSLVANVIGLVILVITIIVNVCIQITTGVIGHDYTMSYILILNMMLCLLSLTISSAITIPSIKKILEFKYQQAIKKTSLIDQNTQHYSLDQLKLYVTRYWIMIQTSNPRFVISINPLSFASNATSVLNWVLLKGLIHQFKGSLSFLSDYKGSTLAICIVQIIGIGVGNVATFQRFIECRLIRKSSMNVLMEFKVEKYWTQKLHEWKEQQLINLPGFHRSNKLVRNLKNIILSICIEFQNLIVVTCKMIRLILEGTVIFFDYCLYPFVSLMVFLRNTLNASTTDDMSEGLRNYVLQLEDETRLTEVTLKFISRKMNHLIRNAEKEQHDNLLKLLDNYNEFTGVVNFDTDQVQPLPSNFQLTNSNWSLPIVTLTCIAISLPNIHKDRSDTLFKSVGEGLYYTRFVEESLNSASEYVNIHKAATNLWQEVEDDCKWLENSLKRNVYNGIKTPIQILKWFADKAKDIVMDITRC